MATEIISKRCNKCKEIKPISEFYKHSNSRDGYRNQCKTCKLKYRKEYHQTKRGKAAEKYYQQSEKGKAAQKRYARSDKGRKVAIAATKRFKIRHLQQVKAVDAVKYAIKTDRLPQPDSLPCHYCQAQAKQYHYYKGYAPEHWLDVIPVCIPCHNKIPKNSVKLIPKMTVSSVPLSRPF